MMLGSMPFCQLFRRSGTAASIMMGAYQVGLGAEFCLCHMAVRL